MGSVRSNRGQEVAGGYIDYLAAVPLGRRHAHKSNSILGKGDRRKGPSIFEVETNEGNVRMTSRRENELKRADVKYEKVTKPKSPSQSRLKYYLNIRDRQYVPHLERLQKEYRNPETAPERKAQLRLQIDSTQKEIDETNATIRKIREQRIKEIER